MTGRFQSAGVLLGLSACTALAMIVRGYGFGVEDQVLYLPFVEHWNDPALFPHDYLLTLSWAKESLTWPIVALAGRWAGLPAVFLILQVIATFLGFYFLFRTANLLWQSQRAAWLSVLLWIPAFDVPGSGITTFDSYFTTRSVGMVAAAGAFYLFLKGRETGAACLLGAGAFFHVLDIVPPAAGMALALVLERRWRELGRFGLIVSGACAGLLTYSRMLGIRHDLWAVYSPDELELFWRKLPDLFPQAWGFSTWLGLVLYLAACGLAYLVHRRRGGMPRHESRLFVVCLGVSLLAGVGMVGAWFGVALLAQLSLVRGVLWVLYALDLWFAAEVLRWLDRPELRLRLVGALLMATWLMGAVGAHSIAVAILAALAFSADPSTPVNHSARAPLGRPLLFALLMLLVLEAYWMIVLPPLGLNREANALPAAVILMGITALIVALPRGIGAVVKPWVLGACVGVVFMLLPTDFMVSSLQGPPFLATWLPSLRTAYARHLSNREAKESARAMVALVKKAVPKDATVVVSPRWMTFRLEAGRSSFVTFKDRCGALYDRGFYGEWRRRMSLIRAYRPGSWEMDDRLDLSEDELMALSRAYAPIHLDYIVTTRRYNLPEVGAAGGMVLYKITPP